MEPLKSHPIADCWPKMPKPDFETFMASIKAHDQAELTVWLYEGMILDGRHRYHAAMRLGLTPTYRQYTGNDPIGFAQAMNDARRHYTEGQLAMTATKLATLRDGYKKSGAQPCAPEPLTQQEAAQKVGVSRRAVQQARTIADSGNEKIIKQVEEGKMGLARAEKIVKQNGHAAKNGHPAPGGDEQINILEKAKEEAARLRQISAEVSRLKKEVLAIAETPIGRFIRCQWVETHGGNFINTINSALPFALCGYCDGTDKRCTACKGGGWVTRDIDKVTVPELRK